APDDKSYQLQLGILRLRSQDERQRASGEQILGALRSDPAQRSAATRALLGAAVAQHDDARKLLDLARELEGYPEATWTDRLSISCGTPTFLVLCANKEKQPRRNVNGGLRQSKHQGKAIS